VDAISFATPETATDDNPPVITTVDEMIAIKRIEKFFTLKSYQTKKTRMSC
jgi:hypothetical protein